MQVRNTQGIFCLPFALNNVHSVTSNAVAEALDTINTKIDNVYHQGVKYGNYDCNTLGEGVALIDGQVLHSPLKEGLVATGIMYIVTMCISTNNSGYRFQLCLSYGSNILCIRTYTDSGWSSWVKIN